MSTIFDTFVTPTLEDALAPQAHRRPIIEVMCDQSIPLFGRYENGVCVEKGRAELRDEHFASLPGYRRGVPYRQGQLAPWSRRGDRRFCDLDGSGRIYSYDLREEEYVAEVAPDGLAIHRKGWVADVFDLGLNGRAEPQKVGEVRERRVDPATGEVAELPFATGNTCVTSFYRWMRDYCAAEADAWRASAAGEAHLAKIAAHAAAQAEARKEALQAPVKALIAELEEIKAAGLAEQDERELAALRELYKATNERYNAAVAEYRRQMAAF